MAARQLWDCGSKGRGRINNVFINGTRSNDFPQPPTTSPIAFPETTQVAGSAKSNDSMGYRAEFNTNEYGVVAAILIGGGCLFLTILFLCKM